LPPGRPAKPAAALERSIRERHARTKLPISLRLDPLPLPVVAGAQQIKAARKIAAAKSVGYQTQLRMWIAEGIQRETKRRSA
jgi:hypothetical protein